MKRATWTTPPTPNAAQPSAQPDISFLTPNQLVALIHEQQQKLVDGYRETGLYADKPRRSVFPHPSPPCIIWMTLFHCLPAENRRHFVTEKKTEVTCYSSAGARTKPANFIASNDEIGHGNHLS
ncbi:unnamed protein product [Agarophyton chilense]